MRMKPDAEKGDPMKSDPMKSDPMAPNGDFRNPDMNPVVDEVAAPLTRRGFMALAALGATSLLFPLAGCAGDVHGGSSGAMSTSAASQSELEALAETIREQMSNMTLEQKVAQLFVVRPEDLLGVGALSTSVADGDVAGDMGSQALTELTDSLKEALEAIPVGGVAYFAQNLIDADQTREMLAQTDDAVTQACGIPPLLCVDEEGGLVARISSNEAFGVEPVDEAAALGAADDAQAAEDTARRIATYLKDLGFNTDFAPVADLAGEDSDNVSISRSFGDDPQKVGKMVAAEVEGFEQEDMICTLKHFPGLGSAAGNTHVETVVTEKSAEEIMSEDAIPFEAGIEAGAPMVMISHLTAPNADELGIPSTTSSIIIMNLLRRDLGFEGVVITDALNMGAITNVYDSGRAAIDCIMAGCDMLLMPQDLQTAYDAVLETVKSGVISADRLNESVARILVMKNRYLDMGNE